jgi:NADH-quinone oxidoreductase subunit H
MNIDAIIAADNSPVHTAGCVCGGDRGVFPLVAGYIVLVERKVMADMQVRLGPMRVGPHGLLQPIADALKLLIKEDIIPEEADKYIFWGAPLISVTTAMLAMAALPIGPFFRSPI